MNGVIIIILLSLKSEKWRADQSACASSEFQLTAGGDSDEYSDLPYSLYLLQRYSLSLSLSFFSYSSLLSYLILGVENKFFPPFFFVFRSKYRDNLTVLANWLLARSIISFNLVALEYLYKYSLDEAGCFEEEFLKGKRIELSIESRVLRYVRIVFDRFGCLAKPRSLFV